MNDRKTVHAPPIDTPQPPRRLDLRGLRCPLPVLKIRKALATLPPGAELVALADDPLAGVDVPNLVRETGDVMFGNDHDGQAFRFRIQKAD